MRIALFDAVRARPTALLQSNGYFISPNCIREIKASDEASRPLCLVHEADMDKGGVPIAQLKLECPRQYRPYTFSQHDNSPRDIIPWLRLSAYQTVSMRLIIENILLASPSFYNYASIPLLMHGDITRNGMMFRAGPTVTAPVILYTSSFNPVRL